MHPRLGWWLLLPTVALSVTGALALADCASLEGLSGASADAGSSEAGDAGSGEAGDAGSGEASDYCASLSPQPIFCADFDNVPVPAFEWTSADLGDDAGTISLASDFYQSPPNSARFVLSAVNLDCQYVRLHREFGSAIASHAHVAFDARLGDADGGLPQGVESLVLGGVVLEYPSGASCEVFVAGDGASAFFAEQDYLPDGSANFVGHPNLVRWPLPGTWSRIEIVLDTTGSPQANILVDGVTRLDTPSSGVLSAGCAGPATPSIYVGFRCNQVTAPVEQRIDNVTFDMQ